MIGKHQCEFCDRDALKRQLLYKNKLASIIYPRRPIIFSHLMIIPNRHVERFGDLTNEEIINMSQLVKKVFSIFKRQQKACGLNLFTNDGLKAGQKIPHAHWHLFFRFDKESISPYEILGNPKLKEKIPAKEWMQRKDKIKSWFL